MTNDEVQLIVGNTPHMSRDQADRMATFIADHRIRTILELGFKHGVSTCFIAAALARTTGGSIVTIDLESARTLSPNIEQLLERIGERDRVEVFYEPTSYTWRLMKFLEKDPTPRFDLCYLDGAHNWFVDGLAFFLVHRLLRPGGWIIFDDLDWTYESSPTLKNTEYVRKMPEDERTTAQVERIYELLVKTHPEFEEFRREAGWAYARRKLASSATERLHRELVVEQVVRIEKVVEKVHVGLGSVLIRGARMLLGR